MMDPLNSFQLFAAGAGTRHILSLCSAAAADDDDDGGGGDEVSWVKGLTRLQACSLNVVEGVLILP